MVLFVLVLVHASAREVPGNHGGQDQETAIMPELVPVKTSGTNGIGDEKNFIYGGGVGGFAGMGGYVGAGGAGIGGMAGIGGFRGIGGGLGGAGVGGIGGVGGVGGIGCNISLLIS